jgi:hypothetical protein
MIHLPARRTGGEVDQRTGLSKSGSEPLATDRDQAVVRSVLQIEQAPESCGRAAAYLESLWAGELDTLAALAEQAERTKDEEVRHEPRRRPR